MTAAEPPTWDSLRQRALLACLRYMSDRRAQEELWVHRRRILFMKLATALSLFITGAKFLGSCDLRGPHLRAAARILHFVSTLQCG